MDTKLTEKRKIRVDVVSDVMCPWCYVGKRHLEKAIDIVTELDVEVHWRPYQLDSTLPPLGKDRQQYLLDKFGPDKAADMYQQLVDTGKESGIDFRFDLIKKSPNTMNAHRLLKWAEAQSLNIQNALVERLFELYFTKGENIGDPKVLIKATKGTGFKLDNIETELTGNKDVDDISNQIEEARQMGVTGVPCFIIELKHGIAGAHPPEAIAQTLRQVAKTS